VKGIFYNEMYALELDKGHWHQQFLRYEQLFTYCFGTEML